MSGSDGLFIGVCLLISSQYRIVQRQLQALGDNGQPAAAAATSKDDYSDEVENERIFGQLKLIAQRHKQTIDITSEMSDLFQPNVFASITIASIKIGLACITLMMVSVTFSRFSICEPETGPCLGRRFEQASIHMVHAGSAD